MTAIVFTHGFMGCSRQFEGIIRRLEPLPSDVHIISHSLPGHSGDLAHFCKYGAKDWQRSVDMLPDRLRREYGRIIIVGHSMGGLLSIRSAAENSDRIDHIFAVSLPLRLRLTVEGVHSRMRSVGRSKPSDTPQIIAAREMCGVEGVSALNSPLLLGRCIDLLRVIAQTKKMLPRLTTPLTVINSTEDDIVSPSSLNRVKALCPGARTVLLQRASHFWFPDDELDTIA